MTAGRAANLEWIMHSEQVSDYIRPLLDAFLRVANEDHRGTRLADEHHFPPQKPPQSSTLEPQIHKLFLGLVKDNPSLSRSTLLRPLSPHVLELEKISISGVIYARERSLPRDSNIIFRRPGGSSDRVGRIKQIFQSEDIADGTTLLVVAQHSSLRTLLCRTFTDGLDLLADICAILWKMATGTLSSPPTWFVTTPRPRCYWGIKR